MENSELTIKEGYKQTDVGIIPEDWEVKKLSEVSNFENGKAHENFIDDMGKYIVVNSKFISTEGEVCKHSNENLSPLKIGDIAMVMSDIPNGKALAKCYLVKQNDLYTLNQRICSIEATKANNEFLFRLLNRNKYFLEFDSGSGQTNLIKIDVLDCPVGLPPTIREQQAIAEVLSDVDVLVTSLDQLITKKRNIKQGAMQLLLMGKKRLPGFSGDWETKTLEDIAPLQRGFDLPNKELKKGINPVVYSNGILNTHNEYKAKAPGIVTGRSGTIGKVNFVEQDYFPHNTSLWVTDFKGNYPKFVYYLYVSTKLERFGTGSGVPTLNRNDVHSYKVSIPPTKEEQKAIAQILSEMDAEIEALEKKQAKYKAVKQGMMQELLTGKTRLIVNCEL